MDTRIVAFLITRWTLFFTGRFTSIHTYDYKCLSCCKFLCKVHVNDLVYILHTSPNIYRYNSIFVNTSQGIYQKPMIKEHILLCAHKQVRRCFDKQFLHKVYPYNFLHTYFDTYGHNLRLSHISYCNVYVEVQFYILMLLNVHSRHGILFCMCPQELPSHVLDRCFYDNFVHKHDRKVTDLNIYCYSLVLGHNIFLQWYDHILKIIINAIIKHFTCYKALCISIPNVHDHNYDI
ncbi:hypothetical protein AGLY_017837 [Aphis glycines]|uniref:Uncharacterized protein n=1 Tax=Aphis glycines TaxID=307491 RepID=A0A6G0STP2_APHGL|nr:hypothetical protein AGLY_017837 [Aphis glycines]